MTGRRLYDALTDSWGKRESWNRAGMFLLPLPPAWAFLSESERRTLNDAARTLTPKRGKS